MKFIKHISGIVPHTNKNIDIPINFKNLIITGNNSSGKTQFLLALKDKLDIYIKEKLIQEKNQIINRINNYKKDLESYQKGSSDYSNRERWLENDLNKLNKIDSGITIEIPEILDITYKFEKKLATISTFDAMRTSNISHANQTTSISNEISNAQNNFTNNLGNKLEQHLYNITVNQSLSLTHKKDSSLFERYNNWFKSFDENLKFLFENESTHLFFEMNDTENKYYIVKDSQKFSFQNLSSGYQAIFNIYSDLLMRTEFFNIAPSELEGIVIIDEIDAHLHISLQKLIFPFFTRSFPKLQFIVSTHSPFVITSTDDDTVVYDISSGDFFEEDLSRYSYESVIKGLFHVNPISSDTKNSIEILKNQLTENPSNYEEIRLIVKNLVELEKNDLLDKSLKNLYLQAINLLADNNQLEDLDV
ncbi:putative ATP-binding protein involved in virulence [Acinetobacter lwoffii]|jgi:predicted ATP-binding protein involved in virulence|uniref:ATP-binding protein involved in virulence n=1 Tax=Acinetobacter lwoffii TaxID=28090 RepID=A0AAW8LKW6_ACILW|nr:AAA family ATPase [Acinetobacter lwoffii]MDR6630470.1 putative ATP-binding protein involved in virulence [Acinetobacter lwoffii]